MTKRIIWGLIIANEIRGLAMALAIAKTIPWRKLYGLD